MKKVLFLCLVLLGCGERDVKKMIIEPHPPAPAVTVHECDIRMDKDLGLKQTAARAAQIFEECRFENDEQFKKYIESQL